MHYVLSRIDIPVCPCLSRLRSVKKKTRYKTTRVGRNACPTFGETPHAVLSSDKNFSRIQEVKMREMCFLQSVGIARQIQLAIVASLFLLLLFPLDSAQAQKQKPPSSQGLERQLDDQAQEPTDDVVRIRTELVQTAVAVFDKQGRFVDNLRTEDFELRIDGKPQPIQFFDRVINGVGRESVTSEGMRKNAVGAV